MLRDVGRLGLYYGIDLRGDDFQASGYATTHIRAARRKDRAHAKDAQKQRLAEFEQIARDTEEWAKATLAETESLQGSATIVGTSMETDGWVPIECNRALKQKYNPHGTTHQFVKWMVDSREKHADTSSPERRTHLHPCVVLYGDLDAPFDLVCRYLSQEQRFKEYNSLLIDSDTVEVLTPHSKICWSQTKKLLFIQPRDFVTFCSHKWQRKDGTQQQLVVHQACEHPTRLESATTETAAPEDENNQGLRAFALRGATLISPHPDDPLGKTKITLLAHCNCGNDIPEWGVRSAVKVLAPIKPFEIIHRIQVGVDANRKELQLLEDQATNNDKPSKKQRKLKLKRLKVKNHHKHKKLERSQRPAGMAQMGYACFWPEGGGLVEP